MAKLGSDYLGEMSDTDAFQFDAFAKIISDDMIKSLSNDQVRIIGVFGEWGTGKTNLLNRIGQKLSEQNQIVCTFRAWEYEAEDNINAAFIRSLAYPGNYPWNANIAKSLKSSERKEKLKHIALDAVKSIAVSGSKSIPVVGGTISALIESVTNSESQLFEMPLVEQVKEYVSKLAKGVIGRRNSKLIVLVDDLDRCNPDTALTLLEWFKNYFDCPECKYVIGIDSEAIESAIFAKYAKYINESSNSRIFGKQYLEKIIDYHYRVPEPKDVTRLFKDNDNDEEWLIRYLDIPAWREEIVHSTKAIEYLLRHPSNNKPRFVRRFIVLLSNTLKQLHLHHRSYREVRREPFTPFWIAFFLLMREHGIEIEQNKINDFVNQNRLTLRDVISRGFALSADYMTSVEESYLNTELHKLRRNEMYTLCDLVGYSLHPISRRPIIRNN